MRITIGSNQQIFHLIPVLLPLVLMIAASNCGMSHLKVTFALSKTMLALLTRCSSILMELVLRPVLQIILLRFGILDLRDLFSTMMLIMMLALKFHSIRMVVTCARHLPIQQSKFGICVKVIFCTHSTAMKAQLHHALSHQLVTTLPQPAMMVWS